MKKPSILTIPLLLVCFTIAGCSGEPSKKAVAEKLVARQTLALKTVPVEGRAVNRSVEAVGGLLPRDESMVGSEVSGTVEKVFVDRATG